MSDLETLQSMGFDSERANLALKAGGNRSLGSQASKPPTTNESCVVNGAIDWLEKNQDRSLEELKEEAAAASTEPSVSAKAVEGDAVAQSWMCNECGKKFRTTSEMQFHANKRFIKSSKLSYCVVANVCL